MKTDSIFYQLFQTFPNLLFELIGETTKRGNEYRFLSQEVKELSRRFDGLFLPPSDSQEDPIYFVEVQIQSKVVAERSRSEDFYWRFFAEIFVYLGQYQPQQDWRAIALSQIIRHRFDSRTNIHRVRFGHYGSTKNRSQ
ncbi:MAG: DUF2887 domain-containing protein [Cyanobacteria bacterium SBLK]|nr:DUF2887 domain-containing protein [Cyanobacteria bacterium SBLK]